MAYFLGRDVDVFITTESTTAESGGTASSIIVLDSGSANDAAVCSLTGTADAAAVSGNCIPELTDATVVSGAINDVTGVDLSISVSDEDVGPFLGHPQIMQKIELRKQTVITVTRKKSNQFWDTIFNGPCATGAFVEGDTPNAMRMGARFGIEFDSGPDAKISNGATYMMDVLESGSTHMTCYGYRLHVRLKDDTSGEIFTVVNSVMTGHTVSLNADGTTEETLEFTSSIVPMPYIPTAANDFYTGLTPIAEL
tara:strand:+ start:2482 stop:3240 length:759 start_codon:yes stop_codon:yes gene_type:complete